MAKSEGQWITVGGKHILLKDGQTKQDFARALQKSAKKKESTKSNPNTSNPNKKGSTVKYTMTHKVETNPFGKDPNKHIVWDKKPNTLYRKKK